MTLPPRAAQSLAIINDAAAWRTVPKDGCRPDGGAEGDSNGGAAERPADSAKSVSPTRRASDPEPVPSVFNLEKQSTVCLVVDDNAQLRAFISNTLSKMFTVVEAADGREALDYALNHPVSIVVTDLAMPVMGEQRLLCLRSAGLLTDGPSLQVVASCSPPFGKTRRRPLSRSSSSPPRPAQRHVSTLCSSAQMTTSSSRSKRGSLWLVSTCVHAFAPLLRTC